MEGSLVSQRDTEPKCVFSLQNHLNPPKKLILSLPLHLFLGCLQKTVSESCLKLGTDSWPPDIRREGWGSLDFYLVKQPCS